MYDIELSVRRTILRHTIMDVSDYHTKTHPLPSAVFAPLRRKSVFMCMGLGGHLSRGTPSTIRGQGPYCTHCANAIFNNDVRVREQASDMLMKTKRTYMFSVHV